MTVVPIVALYFLASVITFALGYNTKHQFFEWERSQQNAAHAAHTAILENNAKRLLEELEVSRANEAFQASRIKLLEDYSRELKALAEDLIKSLKSVDTRLRQVSTIDSTVQGLKGSKLSTPIESLTTSEEESQP